jgi:PAT family beta-lactamase induction signal transducer AmpG
MRAAMRAERSVPHPVVWTLLYLPFGAMSGFVSVALTYLGTKHGLTITETSWLNGANLVSQWLKWTWAPIVDVTLTPKRWYLIGTGASALGVFGMAAVPLSQETLPLLLGIIMVSSLLNSIVGMALEAMMAVLTPLSEQGRTSAWFQAGNLGGSGIVGGWLGLRLLEVVPASWMAGAVLGVVFMSCSLLLLVIPDVSHRGDHARERSIGLAFRGVLTDVVQLARTKGGLLSAFLCFLPIGTGAAQGILTQAAVADQWGATADEVALVQGLFSGLFTIAGCFGGGWLCDRLPPRTAYALIGLLLAAIAALMAVAPTQGEIQLFLGLRLTPYLFWNLVYAYGVGLAYAAFTAVVLNAIGAKSAATKYNLFASLSNFPIWWLGLLLGRIADVAGADAMLYAEALLAVVAVALFAAASWYISRTTLPDVLEA